MATHLLQEREKIKKIITLSFENELQPLKCELQSMLIDDMITAFYSRLEFMKKISQ